MLIVTGIFTFGIAITNYMELTNAVATGAQLLAVSRGQTTDPCAVTAAAVEAAVPTLNSKSLSFSFVINGDSYPGSSCSAGAPADMLQGTPAQVTVTYPCSLSVYGHDYVPSCLLQAQTTELIQ